MDLQEKEENILHLANEKGEIESFTLIDTFYIEEKEYFIILPSGDNNPDKEVWLMGKNKDNLLPVEDVEEFNLVIGSYYDYLEHKEIE